MSYLLLVIRLFY